MKDARGYEIHVGDTVAHLVDHGWVKTGYRRAVGIGTVEKINPHQLRVDGTNRNPEQVVVVVLPEDHAKTLGQLDWAEQDLASFTESFLD